LVEPVDFHRLEARLGFVRAVRMAEPSVRTKAELCETVRPPKLVRAILGGLSDRKPTVNDRTVRLTERLLLMVEKKAVKSPSLHPLHLKIFKKRPI